MLFKIGDKVTNRDGDVGEVVRIVEDDTYGFPVVVNFLRCGTKSYTSDGFYVFDKTFSRNDIATINDIPIKSIKTTSTTPSKPLPSSHSTDMVGGLGIVITLDNGIQIYQSNTGIPILLPATNQNKEHHATI